MNYLETIFTACLIFPIIAFLITIPYMIFNYHKYGSILVVRTFLIYGFILYLLSAYFLVILPLPDLEYVKTLKLDHQLVPFHFVSEIVRYSNFSLSNPSTYLPLFTKPWVYQAIYNMFLTMPFAIFLRYYFKFDFKKITFFTFLLSLFFEFTQLTGLYFIYPNAYRLFDVDDLIVNTCGGMIGYLITPIFGFFLPKKDELDLKAYKKGSKVSFGRRGITFIIDLVFSIIVLIVLFFLREFLSLSYDYYVYVIASLSICYIIIPIITKKTIGGMITNIKISRISGSTKWYHILFRNIIFLFLYLPVPFYLYFIFEFLNSITSNKYDFVTTSLYYLSLIILVILILVRNVILKHQFGYEVITKTKMVSTIDFDAS